MTNIGKPVNAITESDKAIGHLHDVPPAKQILMMLFGAAKVGKTHLVGTLGSRVLYICFDDADGSETLRNKEFFPNLNPLFKVIKQGPTAFDESKNVIDDALDNHYDEFDVIVVDEMTAFQRAGLVKAIEINVEEKRSQTKTKSDRRDGFILPTISDFGTEMRLTDHWVAETIKICKSEGKDLVIVAHEQLIYKKDPGTPINAPETLTRIRPAFTGKKAPDEIIAYFDAVLYLEVINQTKRRLKTVGNDVLVAGHRYGNTLKEMEMDPDLSKIFARIRARNEGK